MNQEKQFPVIDYSLHPAFSPFSPEPYSDIDLSIERHFGNIDAELNDEDKFMAMTDAELNRLFEQKVANELNEIKKICFRRIKENPELEKFLFESFSETEKALKNDVIFIRTGKGYQPGGSRAGKGKQIWEDLNLFGAYSCNLPSNIVGQLNHFSEEVQKGLFHRRTGHMDCTALPDINGDFVRLLISSLEAEGIVEGVSAYLGRRAELASCGLQLSHQDDNWWSNCYSDVGISTPKTVYMHLDEAVTIPKTVVYLSDVKMENGPFRLIKGSHLWKRSASQMMFFKMLDRKWGTIITKNDLKNAPPNYYRKWMWSLKGRRYFAALPYSLRGTSHFGDDIVDGSELSKELLASETSFLSEMGNCVTFIGGKTIHRGGQVERGHRINLQLAWMPRPSLIGRLIRASKRTAYKVVKRPSPFTYK